jgi:hypothetical protein
MNNIFKLHSIKLICGKNRNIYIKTNKKTSKQSKTEFIKYKGEFIKLNTFIREYDKNNKKKRINYYKKNAIIINNIDDIKDKKIRDLFNKTFKKNAKIYIYTDKKLSRGGAFKDDVSRNNDIVAPRNFVAKPHNFATRQPRRSNSRFDDLIPYQLEIDYNNKYDDIIREILKIGKTTLFEQINNLEYTIFVEDGIRYVIRPFIDFAPYKKIFLYFYINTVQFDNNGIQKWIKLPLHLSLFLNDMIEKFETQPVDSSGIKCLTTGHIHITSDDKLKNFNISTHLDNTKYDRRSSTTVSTSTHTYLIAGNLKQADEIFKTHRKEIFKDWFYDKSTETDNKDLKSSLYIPSNNKWVLIKEEDVNAITLTSTQKKQIFECFNKLQYIISNILYILDNGAFSNNNLSGSFIGIISKYISNTVSRVIPPDYLTYRTPTYPTNINIRYFDKDLHKRSGIVYERDLKDAKVNRGQCPGIGHRDHHSHSHHPPASSRGEREPTRRRSRERELTSSRGEREPTRRRSRERELISSRGERELISSRGEREPTRSRGEREPTRRRSREREEIISHAHHTPVRRRSERSRSRSRSRGRGRD